MAELYDSTRLYNDPTVPYSAELYNSTRLYDTASLNYDGISGAVQWTATGSGVSTQTATGIAIRVWSATGTGTGLGTQTAFFVCVRNRQANGSGQGTQTAVGAYTRPRTATGTGVGTQTASRLFTAIRTANGTGTGDSSITQTVTYKKTATGSGTGTETVVSFAVKTRSGTGSGQGSQTQPNWTKSLIFRTPTFDEIALNGFDIDTPRTENVRIADHLLRVFDPLPRGRNVYKLKNGSFTEREPSDEDIATIYFGGHEYFVSPEEKAELVAAGYTVS